MIDELSGICPRTHTSRSDHGLSSPLALLPNRNTVYASNDIYLLKMLYIISVGVWEDRGLWGIYMIMKK
jgi:hypothetical protein